MKKGFGCSSLEKASKREKKGLKPAVDAQELQEQWLSIFGELEDPRGRQGREHAFVSIVVIAILATIGGAKGWEDIELYAECHEAWLETFLDLKNGIPHADTYRRVFERINPDELQKCFLAWIEQIVTKTKGEVIAIDGKTLKGSYDRCEKQKALQVVSAWATEHRLVLGQVKVKNGSNEITAIPALLELLDIRGCVITIDAAGTQTKIAEQIINKGGDYVLCLKANHPSLFAQIKAFFEVASNNNFKGQEYSYDKRVETGHHRREKRQVWVVPVSAIPNLHQPTPWAGLKTVVMVIRKRCLWNKETREVHFYLSSLPCDAVRIGCAIRTHWGIENRLHWVLDITFGEDDCRIRRGYSSENLSLLRRMVISLLNQETSTKRSLTQKSRRAAMDCNYMLQVVAAGLVP